MQPALNGLMMKSTLQVSDIAVRAEEVFGHQEVVGRTAAGVERSTYAQVVERSRRLASALVDLGVRPGDRVATFGWNSIRHLELYFAVPAIGAVLHTVNLRLHPDEIAYILGHAGDKVVFADASAQESLPQVETVGTEVLMPDSSSTRPGALAYEDLVASGSPDFEFPEVDEDRAAALCYTSGTTGHPKGILYSHRSLCLYTLMANQPDAFGIRESDVVMPVVPMFHANAWGWPYIAALAGAKLVLPGPAPTPRILADLIRTERVTCAAAVPAVWQGVADLAPDLDLTSLREAVAGGSTVPETLIRRFDELGTEMTQGWGMTETSPLAAISRVPPGSGAEDPVSLRAKQGRPIPFVRVRVDHDSGEELQVRGPTVARAYYASEANTLTDDGWLKTGDVAELDKLGFVHITDRTKDLIKSGGEWISSVELEIALLAHPAVVEAAAVAMPDEKWGERPCMFVVVRAGRQLDLEEIRDFLSARFNRWSMPDRVEVVEEIPKTSVGKVDKKVLRQQLWREGGDGS
jgi:fatty-acyl-CoA synthase